MAVTTGIYVIQNTTNGKVYIGSARNIQKRWTDHLRDLRSGKHANGRLLNSYLKYGEPAFRFWVAEECSSEALLEREQWWFDMFEPWDRDRGFNIERKPGGGPPSPETRLRMGAAQRLRYLDPEQRRTASELRKGRHISISPELRAKISARTRETWSAAKRGRTLSAEHREKIRVASVATWAKRRCRQ